MEGTQLDDSSDPNDCPFDTSDRIQCPNMDTALCYFNSILPTDKTKAKQLFCGDVSVGLDPGSQSSAIRCFIYDINSFMR